MFTAIFDLLNDISIKIHFYCFRKSKTNCITVRTIAFSSIEEGKNSWKFIPKTLKSCKQLTETDVKCVLNYVPDTFFFVCVCKQNKTRTKKVN